MATIEQNSEYQPGHNNQHGRINAGNLAAGGCKSLDEWYLPALNPPISGALPEVMPNRAGMLLRCNPLYYQRHYSRHTESNSASLQDTNDSGGDMESIGPGHGQRGNRYQHNDDDN
ncbi:hypothetical protein [Acerihabitans arboris]|uniref:Uncharacterized protein n=1 Tax=Acerihabitans arboris TaxID=2691583 RepID=A0A845SGL0_9GAMM|nr:hypothetical protein [Acerihabitans arboris]NDL62084.1 hypothetical protein [Acerihabitans arboris]